MMIAADRIGLVGLGLLGQALADRLMAHGFEVFGYDVRPEAVAAHVEQGGVGCQQAHEVLGVCHQVLLCLPDSQIVSHVVANIAEHIAPHHVLIDTTTGDPDEMVQISELVSARGANYLEANIAGSSQHLRTGDAVVLVGGSEEDFVANERIWQAIAKEAHYLGPVGQASRFKLVHNLVLGLHRAVLGEALLFGEAMGFAPQATLELLRETPAASRVMLDKGDKMVAADYTPQATLSQHLKDVQLILDQAEQHDVAVPLSKLHRKLLEAAEELGFGSADNCAVIEGLRECSSVSLDQESS